MKRSPMPRRRTPLRAKSELRRKTPLRGSSTLRRQRTILQQSAVAKARRTAAQPIIDAVFERDGGCVLATVEVAGSCWGGPTPHHLLKAGQGGEWTPENLVTLCAHHNGWVEDEPDRAWGLGLVVRRGDTIEAAWAAMRNAGLAVWS